MPPPPPLRRYLLRFLIFIPVVWLLSTVFFLQSSNLTVAKEKKISENVEVERQDFEFDIAAPGKFIDQNAQGKESEAIVHRPVEQLVPPKFIENITHNGPGEMGVPVEIDQSKLSAEELREYERGVERFAFNAFVSDMISVHRSLPDVRHEDCRRIQYQAPARRASIIMCFHNEAWSVILRSVHSIIDRSPPYLLKEIILVDDFSSFGQSIDKI